jgi:mRNA interferase HigB
MRVISIQKLQEFWKKYPDSKQPLTDWYNLLSKNEFKDLIALRQTFSDIEYIGQQRYIFNIKGNHDRVVCVIQFNHQTAFIRAVLTHSEYDRLSPSHKKKRSSEKTLFDV